MPVYKKHRVIERVLKGVFRAAQEEDEEEEEEEGGGGGGGGCFDQQTGFKFQEETVKAF